MLHGIDLLILALATWRLSSLFVSEKGPWNVFEKLRVRAGIQYLQVDDKAEYYKAVPDTFMGQLLDCVWCFSMWSGMGWSILYYFFPEVTVWMALPLGLSATAIGMEMIFKNAG